MERDLRGYKAEERETQVVCLHLMTQRGLVRYLWRTRASEESGVELVETALVIAFLLTLLIGIVWMGRAYNTYGTITRAAREGVRFAVGPSCATCGNTYPTDTEIQTVVEQALTASALQPTAVSGFSITRNVVLNPGSTPQETGVQISFSYPFQLVIPFTPVHLTTVSISTRVQMRQE